MHLALQFLSVPVEHKAWALACLFPLSAAETWGYGVKSVKNKEHDDAENLQGLVYIRGWCWC